MDTISGKRVLVTGATGFIGSHLIERLVAEGANVAGLSRNQAPVQTLARLPYRFIRCDICDAVRTSDAIIGFRPDILYHLASHPDGAEGPEQFSKAIAVNLIGSVNVLEAFRMSQGSLLVYGDSTKVYGKAAAPYESTTSPVPTSSYSIAKLGGWQFCKLYERLYGTKSISVRPTLIFGPRQNQNLISYLIDSVARAVPEIRLNGGSQTRAPLYIDDAIDAFVEVAKRGQALAGRIINIGGAEELPVHEIARLVVSAMGKDTRVVSVEAQARPTDVERSSCLNDEARRLLAWFPKTDLTSGLVQTIQFADRASHSGVQEKSAPMAVAMGQTGR
jgi:nucleoside-diphosphate-sugar epimerase